MADEKNPKPGLFAQTLAKAVDLWRILVGLLVSFREQTRAFIEWLADEKSGAERKPWLTKAQWDEIRDVAQSLPLTILKLCICAGLVLNLCRSQIESTPTANPLDGAALVSTELPQIDGWYWLAALWLILSVIEKVVKSITVNIVSKA